MKNGDEKKTETKPKLKYSIHDYKPKKRYTRAEREKIEAGAEFMEIIRKSLEKNEQNEKRRKIMRNGDDKKTETKPKPKYSIHDFKPKKRYTRAEQEKIELMEEFMEIIRESLKRNEQTEKSDA